MHQTKYIGVYPLQVKPWLRRLPFLHELVLSGKFDPYELWEILTEASNNTTLRTLDICATTMEFHHVIMAFAQSVPRLHTLRLYTTFHDQYVAPSAAFGLLRNLQVLVCGASDMHAFLKVFPQLPHLQLLDTDIRYRVMHIESDPWTTSYPNLKILKLGTKWTGMMQRVNFPSLTHFYIRMPLSEYVVTPTTSSLECMFGGAGLVDDVSSVPVPAERCVVSLGEGLGRFTRAYDTLVANVKDVSPDTCPVDE